ncbi:hypothetical protein EVAR_99813_1 [Eumeta japonica]|uniref:Uncharacterized protein n=1 Tax=Eumeta variegata TaxID=151549 RepID=A0A4C2A8Z2_EUMVA|nr:hypothetical protein EVAR_99813_1 [Eumeta japonica]
MPPIHFTKRSVTSDVDTHAQSQHFGRPLARTKAKGRDRRTPLLLVSRETRLRNYNNKADNKGDLPVPGLPRPSRSPAAGSPRRISPFKARYGSVVRERSTETGSRTSGVRKSKQTLKSLKYRLGKVKNEGVSILVCSVGHDQRNQEVGELADWPLFRE